MESRAAGRRAHHRLLIQMATEIEGLVRREIGAGVCRNIGEAPN